MKSIDMGLNTEPKWIQEKIVVQRFINNGDEESAKKWIDVYCKISEDLRDKIIEAVESDGEVSLSWSCIGETRHTMHSEHWAKAMPQYDFEIGRYKCIVRKKRRKESV